MKYKEIIKNEIEKLTSKLAKTGDEKESSRIIYVITQLKNDLNDYEGKEQWLKEPYDKAWEKYRTRTRSISLDEFIESLKKELDEFFDW